MNSPSVAGPATPSPTGGFYVPDLCRVRAIFLLVITTVLVTLLFALVRGGAHWLDWNFFSLSSLLALWIVLTSAAVICRLRRWLPELSTPRATVLLLAVIELDILLCSLVAHAALHWPDSPAPWPWAEVARNMAVGLIIAAIVLRYFYLQHHWRRQKQSELDARLAALQARIHPHFLFNSMNTIASLIAVNPEQAEDAVLDLSELFRASLRTQQRLISLDEELALCRRYLHIEKLRLADRLTLDWQLDPTLGNQSIPPLTLQPLVENAVYHGIQPRPEGGCIRIQTQRKGNTVYIMVHNPLGPDRARNHPGNSIALENIRARLVTLFGDQSVLKTSRPDDGFTVTLRIPWRPLSTGAGELNSVAWETP